MIQEELKEMCDAAKRRNLERFSSGTCRCAQFGDRLLGPPVQGIVIVLDDARCDVPMSLMRTP